MERQDHFVTQGGTTYRWVGNLPDLSRPNGWQRMAMVYPNTTKKSWQSFLRGAIFSDPVPHEGMSTPELKALQLIGAWSPVDKPPVGYQLEVRNGWGMFDFSFDD